MVFGRHLCDDVNPILLAEAIGKKGLKTRETRSGETSSPLRGCYTLLTGHSFMVFDVRRSIPLLPLPIHSRSPNTCAEKR